MASFGLNDRKYKNLSLYIIIIIVFVLLYITFQENRIRSNSNLNIFFTETNKSRDFLTLKQLCSIESAALHNPNANVYLFSLNAKINQELLDTYKNIKFVLSNEQDVYKGTPLLDWWLMQKENLEKGNYKIHDLSDSFRIALVYKYGGIYSDLDILNLKSLEPLKSINAVAYSRLNNKLGTSNAILLFQKNHKFLYSTMINLAKSYKTNIWAYNGPNLIERSVKKYCGIENIYEKLVFNVNEEFSEKKNKDQKKSNCDMVILTNDFFFPVHWSKHKILFEKNSSINISQFKNSYSIHFYGKFSHYYDVKLNDNSIYEFFISKNCPLIYSYLEKKLIAKI